MPRSVHRHSDTQGEIKVSNKSLILYGISITALGGGAAEAQSITEDVSLGEWDRNVTSQQEYTFPSPPYSPYGYTLTSGPATFAGTAGQSGLFNDGQFGNDVPYYAASCSFVLGCGSEPVTVLASFSAASDVTALAFSIGANGDSTPVDISVNGVSLAPITVPTAKGSTMFFGVTDKSGPITSVTFTENYPLRGINYGEVDIVGSYETAVAITPEIDPNSVASGIALLLGGITVLTGRKLAKPRLLSGVIHNA